MGLFRPIEYPPKTGGAKRPAFARELRSFPTQPGRTPPPTTAAPRSAGARSSFRRPTLHQPHRRFLTQSSIPDLGRSFLFLFSSPACSFPCLFGWRPSATTTRRSTSPRRYYSFSLSPPPPSSSRLSRD